MKSVEQQHLHSGLDMGKGKLQHGTACSQEAMGLFEVC